jgi:hypothetical protein
MKLGDMAAACVEAVKSQGPSGYVVIRIPRTTRGERIRITPRSGPLGVVLYDGEGWTVAQFKASAVLVWIQGLVADAEKSAELTKEATDNG